jgi:hypothetical protein
MIDEKIDHHFNEYSPVDFNIFGDEPLYDTLQKANLQNDKAQRLLDHIVALKNQIQSLLNQEDEQLTVAYGFLSHKEQQDYLTFLKSLEEDTMKYMADGMGEGLKTHR